MAARRYWPVGRKREGVFLFDTCTLQDSLSMNRIWCLSNDPPAKGDEKLGEYFCHRFPEF